MYPTKFGKERAREKLKCQKIALLGEASCKLTEFWGRSEDQNEVKIATKIQICLQNKPVVIRSAGPPSSGPEFLSLCDCTQLPDTHNVKNIFYPLSQTDTWQGLHVYFLWFVILLWVGSTFRLLKRTKAVKGSSI